MEFHGLCRSADGIQWLGDLPFCNFSREAWGLGEYYVVTAVRPRSHASGVHVRAAARLGSSKIRAEQPPARGGGDEG